jgi:hypothetical protein
MAPHTPIPLPQCFKAKWRFILIYRFWGTKPYVWIGNEENPLLPSKWVLGCPDLADEVEDAVADCG